VNSDPPRSEAPPASPDAGAGVAILIPCFNEEATIGKVVRDFRAAAPEAKVYVYDNNSTDNSVALAREAGAIVGEEGRQGKGYVIQTMFAQIEADVYVLVDGDDTYSAPDVGKLLRPIREGRAGMVVASRLKTHSSESFRAFHALGNWMFTTLFNLLFGARLSDMLSGYRALSRETVRSITILSGGFDVETELTIRAIDGGITVAEVPLPYGVRPEGSESKLRTIPDGLRVLRRMLLSGRRSRPRILIAAAALLALIVLAAAGLTGWIG